MTKLQLIHFLSGWGFSPAQESLAMDEIHGIILWTSFNFEKFTVARFIERLEDKQTRFLKSDTADLLVKGYAIEKLIADLKSEIQ